MKSLFYALAIVAIGAAGFFGWSAKQKFADQLVERNELTDANTRLSNDNNAKEKEKQEKTAARELALDEESKAKAGLEAAEGKTGDKEKTLAQIENDLTSKLARQKEIDDSIEEIRKKFPGIRLEEVPVKVKELEATVKRLNAEREDAEVIKAGLESDVSSNLAEISRVEEKIEDSIERVSRNVFQATVTAVDNNWNFAVIGAGEKSGLTGDSKLLVQRGGRLIGKLAISKLEANSAVADVVPGSLRPGVIIRPGDQVILAKVRSN
jgi:hypothetical protein